MFAQLGATPWLERLELALNPVGNRRPWAPEHERVPELRHEKFRPAIEVLRRVRQP